MSNGSSLTTNYFYIHIMILLVTENSKKKKTVGTYSEHNIWYVTQKMTYIMILFIYLIISYNLWPKA